ncbi:MAG: hypothetical protein LBD27_04130 [Tannerella sp.]|nr:hypothetical protein [Tannerella sp.]
MRCYSPEGHNFYTRYANGLQQKIKAALLPELKIGLSQRQDAYDESLAFQLALHTANCAFGLYAIMKICPFKTMEDYNIAPQTFFEPHKLNRHINNPVAFVT